MKYKNMSMSIIIPVVANKTEKCVKLKQDIQKYSKEIKYDKNWWSDLGKDKFFNDDNPEEKVVCYELLESDKKFELRSKLELYKNKNDDFNTYVFCNKELKDVKFEISKFRIWQKDNYTFLQIDLITDATEGAKLNTEKIQKLVDIIKNHIQEKIEFFYTDSICDTNSVKIKKRKISLHDVIEGIKKEFIENYEKISFKYSDLFIINYMVAKKNANISEQNLLSEILKINKEKYNNDKEFMELKKKYKYIHLENIQYWFVNSGSLNLFVEEYNRYTDIKEGNLYQSVCNNYLLLLIYSFAMKYEIEEKVFLDNIAKWKIYNRKSDFSKNQHVNDIFKEYLIIALGLDSIDKARIPLDKDVEDRPYVFISYSNEDYKKVYPVLAKLKEDGISFWYDAGLYYGDSWDDQVGNRMHDDNCKGIVFFSSENSFASCNINKEIKKAYDLCKDPESKKKYFAVSLLNVEKTTAILKEAMCKMNQYDLGKNWGTKEIEIIIKAFPDEATVVKTNEVGWLEKIESTIKAYINE